MSERRIASNEFRTLCCASAISELGSAATWTGLPFLAAKLTGDLSAFGTLFVATTLTSIVLQIVGGVAADTISKRSIAVTTNACSAVALVAAYLSLDGRALQLSEFYLWALLLQFIAAIRAPAQTAWSNQICARSGARLDERIATLTSVTTGAKLVGFSLGPLVFETFGIVGLLFDALTFAVAAIVLQYLPVTSDVSGRNVGQRATWADWGTLFHREQASLFAVSALSGAITMPAITCCLMMLTKELNSSAQIVALFWLFGSIGSLLGQILLSRGYFRHLSPLHRFEACSIIGAAAFITLAFGRSIAVTLLAWPVFTATNPVLNILVRAATFRASQSHTQGRVASLSLVGSDVGSLVVMLFVLNSGSWIDARTIFFGFAALVLLRLVVARLFCATALGDKEVRA